jgi:streptogramin lyase
MKGIVVGALVWLLPPAVLAQDSPLGGTSVDRLAVEATIPKGGDPIAFGFNSVWAMAGPTLMRVDVSDGRLVEVPISGASDAIRAIAVGDNAVWIPDTGSDYVYKFDPVTNTVVLSVYAEMASTRGSIAVGEGSLWVVTGIDHTLTRYDDTTGEVQAEIALPGSGAGVLVEGGSVWVTGDVRGELYRVDPKDNAVASVTPLGAAPRYLAAGEGSIWVFNEGDGTVQQIDPLVAQVIATIRIGGPSCTGDITSGGGYVWVTARGIPVARIDPRTNHVDRYTGYNIDMGEGIRFGAGSIWKAGSSIHRLRPPEPLASQ